MVNENHYTLFSAKAVSFAPREMNIERHEVVVEDEGVALLAENYFKKINPPFLLPTAE